MTSKPVAVVSKRSVRRIHIYHIYIHPGVISWLMLARSARAMLAASAASLCRDQFPSSGFRPAPRPQPVRCKFRLDLLAMVDVHNQADHYDRPPFLVLRDADEGRFSLAGLVGTPVVALEIDGCYFAGKQHLPAADLPLVGVDEHDVFHADHGVDRNLEHLGHALVGKRDQARKLVNQKMPTLTVSSTCWSSAFASGSRHGQPPVRARFHPLRDVVNDRQQQRLPSVHRSATRKPRHHEFHPTRDVLKGEEERLFMPARSRCAILSAGSVLMSLTDIVFE